MGTECRHCGSADVQGPFYAYAPDGRELRVFQCRRCGRSASRPVDADRTKYALTSPAAEQLAAIGIRPAPTFTAYDRGLLRVFKIAAQ